VAALTIFTAGAVSRLRALGASGAATAGGAAATPSPTAVRTPAPTPAQTPAATAPATPGTSPGTPGTSPGPTAQPGTGASATATPLATVAPTAAATAAATAGTAPTGPVIASVTDLAPNSGMPFTVPNEVPFAQNPGGPGVLVALPDGRFVAYSARCTHGQCTVAYDPSVSELVCPCHLGRFDPANAAAVLGGPPPLPLAEIPVAVDGSGQVHVVLEG
jgi:Rieske Fe-S protein